MLFGKVPCLPYGTPGTLAIINHIEDYIMDYDVVLLANHGVLAVGKTVHEAYSKIMSLEMLLKTEAARKIMLGDVSNDLPEEEVKMLWEKGLVNHGYHPKK